MLTTPIYCLITTARNEGRFITQTLNSVIRQTVRPAKWIIVSDGSTDGTEDVVRKYATEHTWIELLRMSDRRERHFAGKVVAFNAGYLRLKDTVYDVIGNLDGDVSFERDYFHFLLRKLMENRALGLVGSAFKEVGKESYDYRFVSIMHVSGGCQLFRRECFEMIGGYVPVKGGSVDRIANISARMHGWETRTFTEKFYFHHRPMGTAQQSPLMARFKDGAKDYAVGSHPIWELLRVLYQMTKRPFVFGGVVLAAGYVWSMIRHAERPVSPGLVRFHRGEQMRRLADFLVGKTLRKPGSEGTPSHNEIERVKVPIGP